MSIKNPRKSSWVKGVKTILFGFWLNFFRFQMFGFAVFDKEHRDRGGDGEEDGVREERQSHAKSVHQKTGDDWGKRLGQHACGVIVTGEYPDIGTLGHFDDHRIGVDINGRPAKADDDHRSVDNPAER